MKDDEAFEVTFNTYVDKERDSLRLVGGSRLPRVPRPCAGGALQCFVDKRVVTRNCSVLTLFVCPFGMCAVETLVCSLEVPSACRLT